MTELELFCEPVRTWFHRRFGEATAPQRAGWPLIERGEDTLIAAPTGSGKTLAAFLIVIDRLMRRALAGTLEDALEAVYVSPLRALSHDIQRNLEQPLAEIREEAAALGYSVPPIRVAVRTGDTPSAERQAMLRRPPHILVTTPESLYLLLTADRSRALMRSARTLIVDEIHALARDKRGSHLALSLERVDALAHERPARIGLSATQRPVEVLARFLVGAGARMEDGRPRCHILDMGHQRDLDLAVEVPELEDLSAVASHEQWDDLITKLCRYVDTHHTTLIFVNTRRLAERLAHLMGEKLGEERVAAHHGSLSRERRLRVETRLKQGDLAALVATSSLELGIDIGSVDLVCQIGSPRSIAAFLQRVGRSGHALGKTPKGRLFPTTRDELVECAALLRAALSGRLDTIEPPVAPLDILAQQMVAACACEEWDENALFDRVRGAAPYADLSREDFDAVLEMLARGFETPAGRKATHLHRDRLANVVRGRRGARMAAILSGGAIPDTGDYRVLLDPSDTFVGTVGEDFAVESMAGDVFLLGTHSWRVRRVEADVVRVVDAEGAPPTVPFWVGEAPARTRELSEEVSALRESVARIGPTPSDATLELVGRECGLRPSGARQLVDYVRVQCESMGRVPTCEDIVAERFFDESGGMQLVVHCPYGARVNRAFALALRKRFCKAFNQELQSAATDDAFVLSLSAAQNFPLEELPKFLSSRTIADVLEQAVLATPMFGARWRWNASRALAIPRNHNGRRVPFALQRMRSDDLLAAVFPEQTACQENVSYPLEIPDHPLVRQTLYDCLHEACDVDGARHLLAQIEQGSVRFHTIETVEPSPFAHEILGARPYAYLDDVPLEERRTRAVALRRVLPDDARDLGRLEPEAIERVRGEARPLVRSPDELHEVLLDVLVLDREACAAWSEHAERLVELGRAAWLTFGGRSLLFALECLKPVRALYAGADWAPDVAAIAGCVDPAAAGAVAGDANDRDIVDREAALDRAVRGHLSLRGPVTAEQLAYDLALSPDDVSAALIRCEGRGIAMRGCFDPSLEGIQFCDRGLLARIHRYTLVRLRREIEPVSAQDFGRFLLRWQHLHPDTRARGEGGLLDVIDRLSGFEAPAVVWEPDLLAARVHSYQPTQLDALCLSGAVAWGRLTVGELCTGAQSSRVTPISLFLRTDMEDLLSAACLERGDDTPRLRGEAERILELLLARGALFAREVEATRIALPVQIEEGLRELISRGLVTCDGFAPLRRLLAIKPRPRPGRGRATRVLPRGLPVPEGRWSRLAPLDGVRPLEQRAEATALRLLRRYGVVFRDLLAREWLPESWREVHRALRRLEARGDVRGGRFVTGFIGEQFALPSAIPLLRRERDRDADGCELRISACDPLNLVGVLTPGPRIAAGHMRYVVYRDGLAVSVIDRGQQTSLSVVLSPGRLAVS